jgi:hypothetical protein
MGLVLAFTVVLQAQGPVVEGRGRPDVAVPRVETEATVDGVLDEPAWAEAVRLSGFSQYEPVDGRPAEERTDVRVWYAPDAIWFGIEAWDRQPNAIRATNADRDNIDNDDHVLIFLDTFNDRRRAFFFGVNPLGVQQDGIRSEGTTSAGNMFGTTNDENPDFYYESQGRLTDEGYVVEVRIPFRSLRYPGSGPQAWGVNIQRKVQRTGYTDTWTDVRRASNSFLVQAGTLTGLRDMERGVVLEAQPFITATANGLRDGAGTFARDDVDPDAGLNVRVGWTDLSLDATINPDFSQVESDVGQVTVNERFALFFPEKRPFFLENIDLFAAPNQLVYTRRITSPRVGAKFTGKLGGMGLAHLTAVDDPLFGNDALFNVTRVRADLGTNSVGGVVFTDRSELDGSDFNRLVAADARITFARLYFLEAQFGASWTHADDVTERAPIWNVELDRTGRQWGFNYSLNGVGEDFRADAGFVNRSDIINARAFNRFSFYGERGALLETFTVFLGPNRIWRYGGMTDERAIEGGESVNAMFRFRGGWQVSTEVERSFVALEPEDYNGFFLRTGQGDVPYVPLDRVSGPGIQLRLTTPTFQRLSANASIQHGRAALFDEGSEGKAMSVSASLSLRPTESIRVQLLDTWQRLTRTRDDSEFATTHIPRLQLEFQPSRALFFRAIGEYRAERTAALEDARTGAPLYRSGAVVAEDRSTTFRLDLLASWEPTPGTVAFFGYGSSMATAGTRSFGDLERQSDGFFVKFAWQLRR